MSANHRHGTCSGATILVLSLLWCTTGVRADAQDDGTRHGFWFGLGLGYGLASFSCDSCTHASLSGWSLFFSAGTTPSSHVRAGVEGDFWENGLRKGPLPTIDTWTALLAYYPRIHGGPYIQAGLGLSHYALEHGTGDPLESVSHAAAYAAAMGWGYTVSVGWEGRVRLTYAHGNVGALYGGGPGSANWTQNLFLLEVGGAVR